MLQGDESETVSDITNVVGLNFYLYCTNPEFYLQNSNLTVSQTESTIHFMT